MSKLAFADLLSALAEVGAQPPPGKTYLDTKSASFKNTLPVFMTHLKMDYPDNIRQYILQHLANPAAYKHRPELVRLYRESVGQRTSVQYRFALAIAATSRTNDLQEVIELASEKSLGESRLGLLTYLARSRQPLALQAIKNLQTDPDLEREVAAILKRKEKIAKKANQHPM